MSYSIAVIGGGAAGLLASIAASEHGSSVTLLEQSSVLGARLLRSGDEMCNITNSGTVEHLVQSFPGSGRFLYPAFEAFGNRDILDLLAEEGVLTTEEDRGRILGRARDVLEALERRARSRGVDIRLGARVVSVSRAEKAHGPGGPAFQVGLGSGELLSADRVILCTGSMAQGTDALISDGGIWAQEFGHTIVPPRSATVALGTEEEWPSRVEGVTLRGVEVVVRAAEKVVARYKEDVLFTRFGLSGPAILNVSQQAMETQEQYPDSVIVGVRTDPDLRTEDWEARLQMALRENPRQLLKSLVARWWPVSLAEVLLEVHDIPPEVMANQVTKMHRHQTAELLDEFRLHLKPAHPMATAKVTTGGVDLRDIDPCSMQSLVVSGLFIAGQLLDIDGVSDGYDLQGAYSTGYLAGREAATREPEE